ncbi:hypothetical protein ACF08M_12705 [Streptomyces sp. NPDC015032]|uniref:hypothetical protein n=1 Tax=Streptomyces sp. NPDC015032 TaxID=3364937 RepID=UPI0036FDF7F8
MSDPAHLAICVVKVPATTSVHSLAKYARVSDEGLLNSQDDTDPAARRHRRRSGELSAAGEEHDEYGDINPVARSGIS